MKGYKIILPKKNFQIIADIKKRGFAFLIDLIIFFFFIMTPFMSIFYTSVGIPLENLEVDELLNNESLLTIVLIGDSISYLIFFFYLVSTELLLGATIGKRVMNLSVISKKGKISFWQVILRNLTKSVFITILPFDTFLMFFDAQRRRLSDFLASTLVVENRKRIKKFPVVNES